MAAICDQAGRVLISRVVVADSGPVRMRGLLGRKHLACWEGLLIPRCRLVHTLGMAITLDLVFLSSSGVVLRVVTTPPGRVRACLRARHLLELSEGAALAAGIRPGMALRLPTQAAGAGVSTSGSATAMSLITRRR